MGDLGVRIGEAAALYDLAPSTLRWWEKRGVLTAPAHQGRQRLYREHDLRRLGLAYLCCVTGMMPLDSAAIVTSKRANRDAWQHTIREQVTRLEQQIEQMEAAHDYLSHMLRCEDDDIVKDCPVLDSELTVHTPRGRIHNPDLITAARAARSIDHRHLAETPHRDEKPANDNRRDENSVALVPTCPSCERPVAQPPRGRPRKYCSHACQQRTYRVRRSKRQTH